MKNFFTLIIVISYSHSSFSFTNKDIDTAIYNLCKEIKFHQQASLDQNTYTELAYLKRIHNLDKLALNDSAYLKGIFNNYYYDQYYLYSKFLKENAIVTEDCLHGEFTEKMNVANKLLFYVIYPNSIKLPNNIIDQIEEYATMDEFFGPYQMLINIYYLKKYNYSNLSATQKEQLNKTESRLCKILYTKYIENKSWSFYKLLSVKVLKMNKNELIKNIDITSIVDNYSANKHFEIFEEDKTNNDLFTKVGYGNVRQMQLTATLWIFLLANN